MTTSPVPKSASPAAAQTMGAPKVGIVSLGCPKALVDSERILTRLRAEGYEISPSYDGADVVLVNTCGFLDSAKKESLDAIGEAIKENGRVIVTGCMGVESDMIRQIHPDVLAVTGPHQYEQVVSAVHDAVPPTHNPFTDLVPPEGLRLTPRHHDGQYVVDWRVDLSVDCQLHQQEDAFGNITHSFTAEGPLDALSVAVEGEVDTHETHGVVRGTVERFPPALYLRETGAISLGDYVTHFFLPTLAGNTLGGVALVAGLNFGQVRHEVEG